MARDLLKWSPTANCASKNSTFWLADITVCFAPDRPALAAPPKLVTMGRTSAPVTFAKSRFLTPKLTNFSSWESCGDKQTSKEFKRKLSGIRKSRTNCAILSSMKEKPFHWTRKLWSENLLWWSSKGKLLKISEITCCKRKPRYRKK